MSIHSQQVDELIKAINSLSRGTPCDPGGLEALTFALNGEKPGHDSVVSGLRDIADAIRELAEMAKSSKPNRNNKRFKL